MYVKQSEFNIIVNQVFVRFFQLEASFTANVSAIEANCERVEARMNALLEKFDTKGR